MSRAPGIVFLLALLEPASRPPDAGGFPTRFWVVSCISRAGRLQHHAKLILCHHLVFPSFVTFTLRHPLQPIALARV